MRVSLFGGVLLLALAGAAQAAVYKWVDERGGVHYSTRAPAQVKAQEVRVAPAPSGSANPADADAKPAAATEQQPDGEQAAADQARARSLEKNCEIARQNLKILQDPANRRFSDGGKDPVYYTDEQRAARIADTQKSIEANCTAAADAK